MYISLRMFASIKQKGKIKSIHTPPIHTGKGEACAAVPPRNRSRESPPRLHRCVQRAAAALCNTPLCNGRTGSSSTRHLQQQSLHAGGGMQSRSAGPSQCPSRIAGTAPSPRPRRTRSHPRMHPRTPRPSPGSPPPCWLAGPPDRRRWSCRKAAIERTSMRHSTPPTPPHRTERSRW